MPKVSRFSREAVLAGVLGFDDSSNSDAWLTVLDQHPEEFGDDEIADAERSDPVVAVLRQAVSAGPYRAEPELRHAVRRVLDFTGGYGTITRAADSEGTDCGEQEQCELFSPGTMIREYRILSFLGHGGMGAVYRATHTKLDRVVALKVLPPEFMRSSLNRTRFEREMKAVGRLDHPYIVKALDAGQTEQGQFLVMELVDGVDLAELIKRKSKLSVPDACEIIRQVAIALQHAFEAGLVHRDIKPKNIMLTRKGTVKLLDLGLAQFQSKEVDSLTCAGQLLGTVDYMAPEQAQNSTAADIRADIYGLGCSLYALLVGKPPFASSGTMASKFVAHASEPIPAIPDLPAEVAQLLHRMVAKRPEDRPQTPEEVAMQIVSFCRGHHVQELLEAEKPKNNAADPEHVAIPQPTTKSERHQPALYEPRSITKYLAGGALALALVVFAGVIVIRYVDKDGKPGTVTVKIPGGSKVESIVMPREDPEPSNITQATPTPPPPGKVNQDREVAQWVLDRGGFVAKSFSVDAAGTQYFSKASDLPPEFRELHGVVLPCDCDDKDLAKLNGLLSLRLVGIVGCSKITDAGLKQLTDLPQLICVDISAGGVASDIVEPKITDDGIEHLVKQFPNLECITVPVLVTDKGLSEIASLPMLKSFVAGEGAWTVVGLNKIVKCPKLTYLTIFGICEASDDTLSELSKRTELRSVHMGSDLITSAGVAELAKCRNLQAIELDGRRLTGASLEALATLPELTTLRYYHASFRPEDLESIPKFPKLYDLDFQFTNITDEMLPPIGRSTSLSRVAITKSKSTAKGQQMLKEALPKDSVIVVGN